MKATILVNRHIAAANKKHGKDDPCISIQTNRGIVYAKQIDFTGTATLIQDAQHPRACGAVIWLEAQVECLVIDGIPGADAIAQLPRKKRKPAVEQGSLFE